MARYLILNADDFGYDAETNEAVETLLKSDRITSVSLLAPAPAAADAARTATRLGVSVGVHLCLTSDDGTALWHSVSRIKKIGETLPRDAKALTLGVTHRDVRAELTAQYDRIAALGCAIDHADAHSGALYGLAGRRFYLDAFDLCAHHALPFRFPKTPGFFLRETGGKAAPAVKAMHAAILRQATKRNVLLPDDVRSDPRKPEDIKTRDDLFAYYIAAVRECREGVTEIFLHPRAAEAVPGSPWQKRRWEYELLLSGVLLEEARACGVKVVIPIHAYRGMIQRY